MLEVCGTSKLWLEKQPAVFEQQHESRTTTLESFRFFHVFPETVEEKNQHLEQYFKGILNLMCLKSTEKRQRFFTHFSNLESRHRTKMADGSNTKSGPNIAGIKVRPLVSLNKEGY